jgi:glycosyltransferase involved in cell wall biosynthesis
MSFLSLIIPVYNEEKNLPLLYNSIKCALEPVQQYWEVIFVDDGSRDKSLDILKSLVERDSDHVRAVSFRRNFGQTAAITAGIDHAQGDTIVLMDADTAREARRRIRPRERLA